MGQFWNNSVIFPLLLLYPVQVLWVPARPPYMMNQTIKKIYLSFIIYVLWAIRVLAAQDHIPDFSLQWSDLPSLPPAVGDSLQPGLAGAFIGVDEDALLIAGGANFPAGPSWTGGQKVYHSAIYILEKKGSDYEWFSGKPFDLPHPIAYGLTIGTDQGLFCIGGMDKDSFFKEVWLMRWDGANQEVHLEKRPPLPIAMANMTGGRIGNKLYVAGSTEGDGGKYFWSLDYQDPTANWQSLPTWDGPARVHALGVVQHNGEEQCFYLMKGRYGMPDGKSAVYSDVHRYNPRTNSWQQLQTTPAQDDIPIYAGTAVPHGAAHILLFGGAEPELLHTLEQLGLDIAAVTTPEIGDELIRQRDSIQQNHPGFSRDIYAFHTITQTWAKIGELPMGSQLTTTALVWDGQVVIPLGEIAPCIRTPRLLAGRFDHAPYFGTLNYLVLGTYLLLLVGLGLFFSRKQHNTEDFFKGGKRIPWWAAGISIFGTQLSAITFMAIPAKTFATNWLYFMMSMTIIMVAPFIIRYFLPFFRRFNLTSAYEYLELRFNLGTRLIGSIMYIFLQLGRIGIVLLLPSLALSVVTGIDVYLCILSMGVLSIIYTALGGIEAVIWTDVLQVVVLLGGALLCLVLLWLELDRSEVMASIDHFHKMRIFDLSFNLQQPTLWVVLIGGLAANIVTYGSDQTVIQRYLTTRDEKTAARGINTGAWMTLPATLIFFTLGTLLFCFYQAHPASLDPSMTNNDNIFPWYIITSLPNGVSGLLIAAVFAASMSSLDSAMNSVSTVITTDFFRRLRPLADELAYLRVARWFTLLIGLAGTGLALLMAGRGISSLWDQFNTIIGLFAGGLGGIFLLGIFVTRANGISAIIGLIASGAIQYLVKEYTQVHFLLYAFTGMASAVLIGYLLSYVVGVNKGDKLNYTFQALKKSNTPVT